MAKASITPRIIPDPLPENWEELLEGGELVDNSPGQGEDSLDVMAVFAELASIIRKDVCNG